jgi:ABC-type glycerol-3-phosphate transport system substrate-binding protein
MKSKAYTFSLMLLAVLVGVIAAQCAQPGSPAEEMAPTVEIVVPTPASEVPLTYVSYWDTSYWGPTDRELVERFQEAYPHVKVDWNAYAQSGDNYLTDSVPPDVMSWDAALMYPSIESRGLFMDIGHLWMQEGWEEVIPEKVRVLSQSGGRYYHLPTHYFWTAFVYNEALFAQYDLTPPETWDEFLAVCATLKQHDVTPIAIGFSQGDVWQAILWFDYLNIRINGLEFRDELMLEGQTPFDDARVRDVFTAWEPLVESGYFTEDTRRQRPVQTFVSVLDGEAAMTLASQGYFLDFVPKTRHDELDIFRFPVIDPDIPLGETPGIEGFIIPAAASEPRAAMDFLVYRGSAEAQAYWAEQLGPVGGIPARSDVDLAVFTPAMLKARDMLQNADEFGQFIFWVDSPMVGPMFYSRVFQSFFDDPGTLDEILDKLETRRQEVFEE